MKDFGSASITLLALCLAAFLLNLAFWKASGGTMNMFFVGPANSSLIVFKDISRAAGWYVSTALYIPVVVLGGFLIFLPFWAWNRKRSRA